MISRPSGRLICGHDSTDLRPLLAERGIDLSPSRLTLIGVRARHAHKTALMDLAADPSSR